MDFPFFHDSCSASRSRRGQSLDEGEGHATCAMIIADLLYKIWGEAYTYEEASRPHLHRSLHQHDILDSYTFTTISYVHPIYSARGTFGIDWPKASEHPMFYVAIYAAIGLTDLLCRMLSRITQITSGLRASRHLFKYGTTVLLLSLLMGCQTSLGYSHPCYV